MSSEAFEVEPGRTYEVRFRLRGRAVRVYHTKLWWIDAEGKPIKWFTIGPRHDGDWDWEEVSLSLTVPSAHVHAARLELWALAAGGRLWVDDVSVRPSRSYTVAWSAEEYEVEAAASSPVAIAGPPSIERPARVVSFRTRRKSQVSVTDDAVRIALRSGISLTIPLADGEMLGVRDVRLGDFPLRNPDAPPIAPLVETASGASYKACRYAGHSVAGDGTVTVESRLVSPDGHGARRVLVEQGEGSFRFHARLAELGYVVYCESTGTLGIPAAGFPVANMDSPHPTGPDPATRYGVSGCLGHQSNERQERAINEVITTTIGASPTSRLRQSTSWTRGSSRSRSIRTG